MAPVALPPPDSVAAAIERIAAAEILPRFRNLAAGEIREKGPNDLVTVADEACEAGLIEALTALLPGSAVLGEEGASADPARLDLVRGDRPVWIVDPLDGTWNFAHGIERFVCIVALAHRGETLAGWIHDPIRRVTAQAIRGRGATLGGHPLRVARPLPPGEAVGVVSWPRRGHRLWPVSERLAGTLAETRILRCAGLDYQQLAAGDAQYGFFANLKPWDHAAGVLLHAEAGGHAGLLDDGAPYTPLVTGSGLLLAPDRSSWHLAMSALGLVAEDIGG